MSGSLTSVLKRWSALGDSRALEEDWRFIDSVVENIPDMIFVKDAEHLQFVRLNRAGEELLGYTRDELLSHLRNLKRSAGKDEQALNSVLMIERGTEIIATLIQKLLTLGRPEGEHTAEEAEIGAVLRSVTQLTESQLARAGIRLVLEDAESTLHLTISEKELIQVLLNLMINARDAMADGGGVLTVSATAEGDCGVIRVRTPEWG